MPHEPLTALDAAFLYLERNGPLNVGSLGVFDGGDLLDGDGGPRVAEIRRHVAGRLHLLPRFRRKLMAVPFGLGHPVWVDDPDFDPDDHIRFVALAEPGGPAQLHDLMARVQAEPLDRGRPLWELWIATGLAGGRVAIIQKTHHAVLDGISSVGAARVLFDRDPTPGARNPPVPEWVPQPPPTPAALLAGTLGDAAARSARVLGAAGTALLAPARTASTVARLARSARSALRPTTKCSLNVAAGPGRRYDTFSIDLGDAYTTKRALGCTANDVVLAVVAGGLRHYLAARDEPVDRPLRAMIPVSIRRRAERLSLGNRVSAVFTDLPVHLADPRQRVAAIAAETARLRDGGHAEGVDWFLAAAEHAPAPLYATTAARLPSLQRAVNLVVTNVPGPTAPLYCMGARLTDAYPYVAPVDHLALGVAVLRYNHRLSFGISAGADTGVDLALLTEAAEKAAAELFNDP